MLAVLSAACGMGPFADEGGGDSALPHLGAGPYRLLPEDFDTPAKEPYVVAQQVVSLLDPAVLGSTDDGFTIYYSKVDDVKSEIWRVALPSIYELVEGSPQQVLVADQDWEQGQVSAAAVVQDEQRLVMYYQGGVTLRSIGRAVSTDGGQSFVKDSAPLIVDALDPYVVKFQGRWHMVHTDSDAQRVLLRESEKGLQFGEGREILRARSGVDTAIDQYGLQSPALDLRSTLDGGVHYGLFYSGVGRPNGEDESIESIGYVASFDGEQWQRFMSGNAILEPGPTGAGGAAPILGGSESLLFFHQLRQGRGRIAVALSP